MNVSDPPAQFAPGGRVRALAYRALWSVATLFHRAASASIHVAAGLLTREELKSVSQTLWSNFCAEGEQVDGGLEPWERRMFEHLLRPSERVLLIGCGAGRELLALKEQGYEVTGLDPATGIAGRALGHLARRGMNASVISAFVEDADLHGSYDAIVFSGNCYSYLQGKARRISTLARLRTRLSEGGRIGLTYTCRHHRTPLTIWLTTVATRLRRADWRPEHGDVFSRAHAGPGVLAYDHVFAAGEVAQECARAGLRVVCDEDTAAMPWVIAVVASAEGADGAEAGSTQSLQKSRTVSHYRITDARQQREASRVNQTPNRHAVDEA